MKQYVKTFESFYNDFQNYGKIYEEKYPSNPKASDPYGALFPFYMVNLNPKNFDLDWWLDLSSADFYKIFKRNAPEKITPGKFLIWILSVASGNEYNKSFHLPEYKSTKIISAYSNKFQGSFVTSNFFSTDYILDEPNQKFDKLRDYLFTLGYGETAPSKVKFKFSDILGNDFKNLSVFNTMKNQKNYKVVLNNTFYNQMVKNYEKYYGPKLIINFKNNFYNNFSFTAAHHAFAPGVMFATNDKEKPITSFTKNEQSRFFEILNQHIYSDISDAGRNMLISKGWIINNNNNNDTSSYSINASLEDKDIQKTLFG